MEGSTGRYKSIITSIMESGDTCTSMQEKLLLLIAMNLDSIAFQLEEQTSLMFVDTLNMKTRKEVQNDN